MEGHEPCKIPIKSCLLCEASPARGFARQAQHRCSLRQADEQNKNAADGSHAWQTNRHKDFDRWKATTTKIVDFLKTPRTNLKTSSRKGLWKKKQNNKHTPNKRKTDHKRFCWPLSCKSPLKPLVYLQECSTKHARRLLGTAPEGNVLKLGLLFPWGCSSNTPSIKRNNS